MIHSYFMFVDAYEIILNSDIFEFEINPQIVIALYSQFPFLVIMFPYH